MKNIIILLTLLSFPFCVIGQTSIDSVALRRQIRQDTLYRNHFCKDIEFVINKIESTYVCGRRGMSDEEWNKRVQMIYDKGRTSDLSTKEYYYALRYTGLLLNDGHFNFPDGGIFNRRGIFQKDDIIFPIRVKTWEDGSVYTVRDYTGSIPKDSEIVSVNGRSAKEMALFNRLLYSGEDLYAMDQMNLYCEPDPRAWNTFTNFLFMEQIKPPYTVVYIVGNKADTVTIDGMGRDKIFKIYKKSGDQRAANKARGGSFFSKAIRYKKVDDNLGVLSINMFWNKNLIEMLLLHKDAGYPRQLKRAMRKIDKDGVNNLIIDLSVNSGGMADNLYKTLNYFTDKPINTAIQYTVTENNRKITGIRAMNSLGKYLGITKDQKKRLGEFIDSLPAGTTFCTDTLFPVIYKPNNPKHSYRGNVYVLTSNYTFSAAQMFIQYVQKLNIGKVAGQPCGGYSIITGGNTDRATLPCYGDFIDFFIPTTLSKKHLTYDKYEYEKVDIPIERSFEEWLSGKETSLDKLIEIIQHKCK